MKQERSIYFPPNYIHIDKSTTFLQLLSLFFFYNAKFSITFSKFFLCYKNQFLIIELS